MCLGQCVRNEREGAVDYQHASWGEPPSRPAALQRTRSCRGDQDSLEILVPVGRGGRRVLSVSHEALKLRWASRSTGSGQSQE